MPNVGAVAQWASSTTTRTGAAALAVITRSATASNIRDVGCRVGHRRVREVAQLVGEAGNYKAQFGVPGRGDDHIGGVVVAHLVTASTKGWKGAPTSSSQRPHSTSAPSSAARAANSATSRVSPAPASPATTTTRPRPSWADAHSFESWASSSDRPTKTPARSWCGAGRRPGGEGGECDWVGTA